MSERGPVFKLFMVIFLMALGYAILLSTKDQYSLPPLNNGDIIFQTNMDPQAWAVTAATLSLYTHTGIIKKSMEGYNVIEAADVVRETPLREWINRGSLFRRFAIYRYKNLPPQKGEDIIDAAKKYYGRQYDIWFYPDDREIYCSELPYLAYQGAGISIGTVQKVSELNLDNSFVRKLIQHRWDTYPACIGHNYTFEQCYAIIQSETIITPVSIANDKNFELIYTNYRL